ncbi:MAG TPA: universal stress protein [Polyangiaceae bacterium]|nr:universal stress protein [Polyangiaceae bacterium]
MTEPQRIAIVVGVDFSKTGDLAMDHALELALDRGDTDLHLVNVVRTYGAGVQLELPGSPGFSSMSLGDAAEQLRLYAQQRLDRYQAERGRSDKAASLRIVTHVRLDAPAEEITQLAADLQADLVVVGTHGRRGLSRVLMGSVAEGVVRLAPCTVLVVRPKDAVSPHIEPPCPDCLKVRRESGGREFWCAQHRERHGQRHTYLASDKPAEDGTRKRVLTER